MSLVFGNVTHTGGPQMHVFIVGVGRYPHLLGGTQPTEGLPPLNQLTSPPISARALADWFLAAVHNPSAPLGSLEILLSDARDQTYVAPASGPGVPPVVIDGATSNNVADAFERWFKRCDAHKDNIAVFYFCGHGVQKDVLMLMPEDVGASSLRAWELAFDFDATYRGMARCAARTQYYFIDACRQLTSSMLSKDFKGRTLVEGDLWQQNERMAPKLFATTTGHPAFGDRDGISRYTAALLKSLQGGAGTKRQGQWVVDTERLARSVQRIIDWENRNLPSDERQTVVASGDTTVAVRTLHVLQGPPLVRTAVVCVPAQATDLAEFFIEGTKKYQRVPAAAGTWAEDVEAGVYDVRAQFTLNEFPGQVRKDEFIEPPIYEIELEVEP